jgi:hypothetical protein
MNKLILMVSGSREGKNIFQKTLKENLNYWVWNVNPGNEANYIIGLLGWDGLEKDNKYQEFYDQLFDMAEKTFGFRKVYIDKMIDRFLAHDRAQILIIHQAEDMLEDLKDDDGILSLYVAKTKGELENNLNKYDKVLLLDEDFEENLKQTIVILTKDKETINA